MIVWTLVSLLACCAAQPTGKLLEWNGSGRKPVPVQQDAILGVVAHEVVPRVQDPTDSLICKYIQQASRTLYLIPSPQLFSFRNSILGKYFVTAPVTALSPASYFAAPPPTPPLFATLCVSPENPRPFPLLFSPPPPSSLVAVPAAHPPASSPLAPLTSSESTNAPPAPIEAADPTPMSSVSPITPAEVSKAPAPSAFSPGSAAVPSSLSLVFGSPVGSIGIGGTSSPAVNIELQQITDTQSSSLSLRGEPVDLVSWRVDSEFGENKVNFPKYVNAVWDPSSISPNPVFLMPASGLVLL